jgi:hypothetical protein
MLGLKSFCEDLGFVAKTPRGDLGCFACRAFVRQAWRKIMDELVGVDARFELVG